MNVLALLSGGCVAVSIFALYKERTIAAAAATLISITLLVMTLGGR